ncbi:MAG: hypothetical protein ACXVXH_18365, partial [Nocardioidaceae bacterium]
MSHRFVRPRPEVAGAVLLLGLCGWVLLAGLHGHASPYPVLFAVATLAGAYVAGRAAGRHAALVAVPAAILVAVALARTGDPRQAGP